MKAFIALFYLHCLSMLMPLLNKCNIFSSLWDMFVEILRVNFSCKLCFSTQGFFLYWHTGNSRIYSWFKLFDTKNESFYLLVLPLLHLSLCVCLSSPAPLMSYVLALMALISFCLVSFDTDSFSVIMELLMRIPQGITNWWSLFMTEISSHLIFILEFRLQY